MTRPRYSPAVGIVVAAQAAVLLAMSPFYGPHRDELYFVSAGQRLAWGYPDQPVLTPFLARVATEIAPYNLVVLRLWSLLAMVGLVLLAAEFARLAGGGRTAQVLTAGLVAVGVVTMTFGHWHSTATFDALAWTAILVLVARALIADGGRQRGLFWLAAGIVAGIGLENKHSVVFLLGAILFGIALVPATRRNLTTPWPWLAGLTALVLWTPNLLWQLEHDWPVLDLSEDIREEYGGLTGRIGYVTQALILLSPVITPIWIIGLVALFRRREWALVRPVAVAFVLVAGFFLVAGGKGYYLAGLFPPLVAAGSVVVAERLRPRTVGLLGAGLALLTIPAWPINLPVLPAKTYAGSFYTAAGEDQLETIGWPQYAAQVRAVVDDLTPAQRRTAVVFTTNYGEAGALEWYGAGVPVHSGHNGWRFWEQPPKDATPIVVVGFEAPDRFFDGCRQVASLHNREGADNEENGAPIHVCDTPTRPWSQLWHYSA
ncbi:glycosyltransferase family 39 protein [Nocardioides sp. NPDC087217]|uniref:glycosyltransferase family 39 protein n=1 Tax=Nocardioides sp. NPDC087217 TaxID=3364335 RepID=UPI00380C5A06